MYEQAFQFLATLPNFSNDEVVDRSDETEVEYFQVRTFLGEREEGRGVEFVERVKVEMGEGGTGVREEREERGDREVDAAM